VSGPAEHVLVTGAAGAIGAAIARRFARRDAGALLSLVDIDLAGAERVAREIGPRAKAERWDLAEPSSLPACFDALVAAKGPVDILVNCAGIMEIRAFAATDWEVGARLLRIDLESPLRLMSLAVASMRARRRGTIVNVSSMAGVTPLRGCSFYSAAKAGLAMASEIARSELAPAGVHVVTVYPGPVRSGLERRARAQVAETALTRLLPTGEAEPLAARIVDACDKKKPRVVYPPFYEVANRFPGIAARASVALSPMPKDA
jgi:short-subunit dehydrogenase